MFETVKQILGVGAESAATREADPEDLFGMSTAYLTMEADLGFVPTGDAALCFASVDSTAFNDVKSDVEAILETGEDTGTVAQIREDDYGYQWVVVEAQDFEDLVTTVHFAADTLIEGQFGSRLLAAVFSFEATDRASTDIGQSAYWVYSFRRGSFYPFAPVSTSKRDSSVEFTLESVLDGELAVEDDQDYWYALWPDSPGTHPWE
ncbi:MAG: hypothetical protein J07HX64_00524 [halophilic archaeon J07HX64]|jgi:hypothetical protein|nr:MAG: hypothetical protein J07HX64_00524 [halophilic archaeon J07HX64]